MTKLRITNHNGVRSASVSHLELHPGSQIELTTSRGDATTVYLSNKTAGIVQPSMQNSKFEIAAGTSLRLTFGAVTAGTYSIVLQSPKLAPPSEIVDNDSGATVLAIFSPTVGGSYPVNTPDPQEIPSGDGGDVQP